MCRFLSKLLSSCCCLTSPYCYCLCFAFFLFTQNASAQVVAIEDPIGAPLLNDSTDNPDPDPFANGTELSTLTAESLQTIITTQKISLKAGPDQLINEVAIFNTSGQLVFAATIDRPNYTQSFDRELRGVYILIVQSTQGVLHQKLHLQP